MESLRSIEVEPIRRGNLYIIGGGEIPLDIYAAMVQSIKTKAAGNPEVAIITYATNYPEEAYLNQYDIFHRYGYNSNHIGIETSYTTTIASLEKAGLVFMTGGDQAKLNDELEKRGLQILLRTLLNQGTTFAGTSAGAMVMSENIVIPSDNDNPSHVELIPGVGLVVNGILIDSHFGERRRLGRLGGIVQGEDNIVGLGVDEHTAVEDAAGVLRVLGDGNATVVRRDGTVDYFSNGEIIDFKRSAPRYRVHDFAA